MRAFLTFLVVLLVVGGLVGVAYDRRLTAKFHSIQPHAAESNVRSELGSPSKTDASCSAYDTQQATHCDHVLVYKSAFAFVTHRYWLVFIDPSGTVTATSMQVEP
jgi:hypothetical protein